ncbi:MAG: hypothetical protein RL160_1875 [Bacteroidota bacterium]
MKRKLLTLLAALSATTGLLWGQAPSGFNYQAALRNTSGSPLASQNVSLRFTIRDGGVAGSILFQETHNKTTNAQGMISCIVGAGSLLQGAYPTGVQWGTGVKFLQVEADAAGGSSYTEISNTQMMSVPYSNFAGSAASLSPSASITPAQIQAGGATNGQVLKWNGSAWAPGSAGGTSGTVALTQLEQGSATNGQIIRWNGTNWVPSNDGPNSLAPSQLTQDGAANGQVLKWNGTNWVPSSIGVTSLAPSQLTSDGASNGQVLKWNGTNWVPSTDGPTSFNPSQITAGGANNGQVLKWNGSNWVPSADDNTVLTGGTGITINSGAINSVWTTSGNNIHNNNTANVGIGTTAPATTLDVYQSTGNTEIRAQTGASTGHAGLKLGGSGANMDLFRYGSSATGTVAGWPGKDLGILNNSAAGSLILNTADSIGFATGATERMRITSRGVSIGGTFPQGKLHVIGNGRGVIDIPQSAYYFSTPIYGVGDTTITGVAMPGLLGYGRGSASFNAGVAGIAGNSGSFNVGALFESTAPGISGKRNYGIYNSVTSGYVFGVGMFTGMTATTNSTNGNYGLYTAISGTAAAASMAGYFDASPTNSSASNYGIYASATNGATNYAGYFSGNVTVTGTLSKSGGTFQIDHPQDPENKYLIHSFVESPDMMNIYNGNITTDAQGFATVQLPDYFESLNMEFRYQLTVVGPDFAQAIVSEKIDGNKFKIRTDKPNTEVSWQVTGVRNDPWAKANRFVPERAKEPNARGKYLHPELYGQPVNKGIHYQNRDGIAAPATKIAH